MLVDESLEKRNDGVFDCKLGGCESLWGRGLLSPTCKAFARKAEIGWRYSYDELMPTY
jgi:hypothetical protein